MATTQDVTQQQSELLKEFNLGVELLQRKDFVNAAPHFEKVIALDRNNFDAAQLAGMCFVQIKDQNKALHYMSLALELRPDNIGALSNLAVLLNQAGNLRAALDLYERIAKLDPQHVQALYNCGVIWGLLGDKSKALEKYNLTLAVNPDMRDALLNKGALLQDLGQHQDSIAGYQSILKGNPKDVTAWGNLGAAHFELGAYQQALACYRQASALDPSNSQTIFHVGITHLKMGDHALAIELFNQALVLKPDCADYLNNRALAFKDLKQFNEAIRDFDRAIALSPINATFKNNKGIALMELGNIGGAISYFQAALGLQPHYAEVRYNLALCYLLNGDYSKGWREYEWRWKASSIAKKLGKRDLKEPLWLGKESIANKTILIYWEQGFGDTIQFARYVKLLENQGATVMFEVQPELKSLCTGLGEVRVFSAHDSVPAFDFQCPLMSLPFALQKEVDFIPSCKDLISVNADQLSIWGARLGERKKRRIGIAWSGNPIHSNDKNRSMPLEVLKSALGSEVELICLQKDIHVSDRRLLDSGEIVYFGDEVQDFSDTATLCSLVDEVVSIDTAIVHLAGSLGVKTRLLLPFRPDWRWLMNTSSTQWYESVSIIRQKQMGDWQSVAEQLRAGV